eukprot:TRINITY_DN7828_c0_g1_i12.p3 TRINITY_DN7828_c0_g1~~TRINITY_DN7828_c0_g1_i12.p3  ORF type:complete len:128 (+),score=20.54 TRINITY_DN7828_c0_g1_i12:286-669(+)
MITKLYRDTRLGQSLRDTLEDMEKNNYIKKEMSDKILDKFDQVFLNFVRSSRPNKSTIKGHLHNYGHCDNVWRFDLQKANVKTDNDTFMSDNLKIMAIDASNHEQPKEKLKKEAIKHGKRTTSQRQN